MTLLHEMQSAQIKAAEDVVLKNLDKLGVGTNCTKRLSDRANITIGELNELREDLKFALQQLMVMEHNQDWGKANELRKKHGIEL